MSDTFTSIHINLNNTNIDLIPVNYFDVINIENPSSNKKVVLYEMTLINSNTNLQCTIPYYKSY